MKRHALPAILMFNVIIAINASCNTIGAEKNSLVADSTISKDGKAGASVNLSSPQEKTIDTIEYNKKLLELSNHDTTGLWPQKFAYPLPGAIFPYNRIVAF